jgi:chaperonin GroEL (HSP60 family)
MEHIGCEILKEACQQFEIVGDNTSLVCILVQAFFKKLFGRIKKGTY